MLEEKGGVELDASKGLDRIDGDGRDGSDHRFPSNRFEEEEDEGYESSCGGGEEEGKGEEGGHGREEGGGERGKSELTSKEARRRRRLISEFVELYIFWSPKVSPHTYQRREHFSGQLWPRIEL